jgi:hypothetical protein
MFRRLGALEKLFLVDRSSPQPPPFRMRWHSFSASRPRGVDRAQNSLLLNLASALTELRAGLRPGIFLVGSPSARVCRSAGRYFPAINLESAVINELRANSRAISTSGIKGFKSTEMNTCAKLCGGCRSPNALVSSWLPDYSSGVREELSSRVAASEVTGGFS